MKFLDAVDSGDLDMVQKLIPEASQCDIREAVVLATRQFHNPVLTYLVNYQANNLYGPILATLAPHFKSIEAWLRGDIDKTPFDEVNKAIKGLRSQPLGQDPMYLHQVNLVKEVLLKDRPARLPVKVASQLIDELKDTLLDALVLNLNEDTLKQTKEAVKQILLSDLGEHTKVIFACDVKHQEMFKYPTRKLYNVYVNLVKDSCGQARKVLENELKNVIVECTIDNLANLPTIKTNLKRVLVKGLV